MNLRTRLTAVAFAILSPPPIWASGAVGLPWEQPLNLIARSLTGPVALAISIVALTVAGGVLVFGGDLTEFGRKACHIVMAIAFLVAGSSFMSILFGVSGALV